MFMTEINEKSAARTIGRRICLISSGRSLGSRDPQAD
jgi:hypothetical protein